jgi:hypothetical protein
MPGILLTTSRAVLRRAAWFPACPPVMPELSAEPARLWPRRWRPGFCAGGGPVPLAEVGHRRASRAPQAEPQRCVMRLVPADRAPMRLARVSGRPLGPGKIRVGEARIVGMGILEQALCRLLNYANYTLVLDGEAGRLRGIIRS